MWFHCILHLIKYTQFQLFFLIIAAASHKSLVRQMSHEMSGAVKRQMSRKISAMDQDKDAEHKDDEVQKDWLFNSLI